MCVIRTLALRLIRFNEMSADLAALEGEGDLNWRTGKRHTGPFEREGNWSPEMELVYEEFAVLEIAP